MTPPLARGGGSQARLMMRHRARVTRAGVTAEDEYGHPAYDDTPSVVHEAVPCYAWAPTDPRELLDVDGSATLGAVRLTMPLDCGVGELDTITQIVDRAGRVVFDGPLNVTAATPLGASLAVMARATRAAG